jgi:hypothetical protein
MGGGIMRTWLIGQVVLFTMLGIAGRTPARTIVFDDFSDVSSLTLNGSAAQAITADGAVLRLTPALGNQSGSAFSTQTINGVTFSTYFRFRISNAGGAYLWDDNPDLGADGLVFVSQPVSASLGGTGQAIGYGGISPSVGVEFDTWHNGWNNDPDSNHLGIDLNGDVYHDPTAFYAVSVIPRFDDANIWHAWVDYDGTTLEVRASQSGTRPALPTLTRDVDIPSLLGATDVYVGFTSGTGNNWGDHDLVYWEYRDEHDPIIPEPSTWALLAVGAVCLAASARRRSNKISATEP